MYSGRKEDTQALPVVSNPIFNATRRRQPLSVASNTIFNVMRRVSTLPAMPNPLLTTTMRRALYYIYLI